MNNQYTYQELSNIGQGTSYKGYTDDSTGKTKESRKPTSFYHKERGTYSILTGHKYLRVFKTIKLSDVLDKPEDIGRATILRENICEDNMIMYTTGDKKITTVATRENICRMVKLSPKRGGEFLDRMIDKGIVSVWEEKKTKVKRYYLNPLYGMIGTEISLPVYRLFAEQLDPYLTAAAREDLAKLAWVATHPSEYEEMTREYEAQQQLEREATEARMDAELELMFDETMKDIKEAKIEEVFDVDHQEVGYELVKQSIDIFEAYGLKAKLNMNKTIATIDNINACRNAIDFFCNKSQNKAAVTLISKGLITFVDDK